jgi:hypothetical protein
MYFPLYPLLLHEVRIHSRSILQAMSLWLWHWTLVRHCARVAAFFHGSADGAETACMLAWLVHSMLQRAHEMKSVHRRRRSVGVHACVVVAGIGITKLRIDQREAASCMHTNVTTHGREQAEEEEREIETHGHGPRAACVGLARRREVEGEDDPRHGRPVHSVSSPARFLCTYAAAQPSICSLLRLKNKYSKSIDLTWSQTNVILRRLF